AALPIYCRLGSAVNPDGAPPVSPAGLAWISWATARRSWSAVRLKRVGGEQTLAADPKRGRAGPRRAYAVSNNRRPRSVASWASLGTVTLRSVSAARRVAAPGRAAPPPVTSSRR